MADQRLRELERAWEESRLSSVGFVLLRELERSGKNILSEPMVRLRAEIDRDQVTLDALDGKFDPWNLATVTGAEIYQPRNRRFTVLRAELTSPLGDKTEFQAINEFQEDFQGVEPRPRISPHLLRFVCACLDMPVRAAYSPALNESDADLLIGSRILWLNRELVTRHGRQFKVWDFLPTMRVPNLPTVRTEEIK